MDGLMYVGIHIKDAIMQPMAGTQKWQHKFSSLKGYLFYVVRIC